MSKDAVLTLFDEMRKRALGISDKTEPRTGFLFSMLPVGLPLNAEDFRAPWSPALKNLPKPQDPQELAKALEVEHRAQNALLSLSQFVNFKLSTDGTGTIMPANTRVSDTWKLILDSASPSPNRPAPNSAAVQRVRDAEAYLRDKHDDTADSVEYKRYKARKTAYEAAILAYTVDYQNAMKTPESAAAWPVAGMASFGKVDIAYNDWIAIGHKDEVEQKLNTIAAQGKDAVEAVIAMAKRKFDPYQLTLGVIVDKTPYVQVFPSDWAEPNSEDSGWTTFGYSESDTSTTHSDESTSWGASGGFSFGFWSVRAGGGNSQREVHDTFSSEGLAIEMTFGVATISRPWLNSILLNVKGWSIPGQDEAVISNGTQSQTAAPSDEALWLPALPTHMLIVKNVKIKTNSMQTSYDSLEEHTRGGGGFGWGPFSFGGSYSRDTYRTSSHSHIEDGWVVIDGAQLIGWISQVLPLSPSESGK